MLFHFFSFLRFALREHSPEEPEKSDTENCDGEKRGERERERAQQRIINGFTRDESTSTRRGAWGALTGPREEGSHDEGYVRHGLARRRGGGGVWSSALCRRGARRNLTLRAGSPVQSR